MKANDLMKAKPSLQGTETMALLQLRPLLKTCDEMNVGAVFREKRLSSTKEHCL